MKNWIICLVVLVAAGCGGGENNPLGPSSTLDISGSWSGIWASETGRSGDVAVTFSQIGRSIDGTVHISNSPCFTTVDITGFISGNSVSLTLSGIGVFTSNKASLDSIEGSYSISEGPCNGDSGIFELTK